MPETVLSGAGLAGDAVGTFALVLHSHLPWLAHAGTWPVGEEWLHQAWASSYAPVVEVLERLAGEGRRELLTLGVTPVLAAQLDDAYCLREHATWLGGWLARAEGAADPVLRAREGQDAAHALSRFERQWAHGASPVFRGLSDSGAVELLGGPATHPFTPLLDERIAHAQLAAGLADGAARWGRRPHGSWLPECAYRPGLEHLLDRVGVRHLVLDGPAVHGRTAAAVTLGESSVIAFTRDLTVSYRVWSPRAGYPGGEHYRDFHTFDHDSGLRPARVTSRSTPPEGKRPYDPQRARLAVERDAADFVAVVRARLLAHAETRGKGGGLVVAAFDTELFGHWWHEGPQWLERVLRLLPEAGVRVTTLQGAVEAGCLAGPAQVAETSWGRGKDWRVWTGPEDLAATGAELQSRLLRVVDKNSDAAAARSDGLDQLTREVFLATASDWAFMVSHGSAADYARGRAQGHADRAHRLADLLEADQHERADRLAAGWRTDDGSLGFLGAHELLASREPG